MTAVWASDATIRTSLRFRVGQGTSTELLSDDELDECLNGARQEINRIKPMYTFASFLTVASQQRYNVVPATNNGPMKIFWRTAGSATCDSLGLFGELGDVNAFFLSQLYNGGVGYLQQINQIRIELIVRSMTIIQKYFGGIGWQGDDGMVWLSPTPNVGGTNVYYFNPIVRFAANTDIDTQYVEPFLDYAQMIACNLMAAKQSEVASTKIAFGKAISTAGGMIYYKMARDAERRFYNFMAQPATYKFI